MLLADTDWQGIAMVITAISSLVAAIFAGLAREKAAATGRDVVAVKADIRKVELATNSMKDQLVEATRAGAQAAGEQKGRADQKAEDTAVSLPPPTE